MPHRITGRARLRLTASALAIVAGLLGADAASAQEPSAGEILLDEVVIYGARDANTLGDTSASVGVVNDQAIADNAIRTFRDAFRRLANVSDADFTDAGFVIRGVNSEGFVPGGEPLASLYVDGIQQTVNGTRRGSRGLWDVEQVEVYRGPQSTLSGRAALAGAIYLKSKDPTFEREARLSGTAGSDHLAGGAFMLNAPVVDDQLAIRLSGEYERSESDLDYRTYERFDRFDDFRTDEFLNLRGKVLLQPAEMPGTRALLTYSFSHDSPDSDDIAGPGLGLGFEFRDRRGDFNDPVFAESRSADVHNVGLEVTHEITEALKLTSLTTYSSSNLNRPSVNEGTEGEINVTNGFQDERLATQEVRLNYAGERWDWVGGLYASYEDDDSRSNRTSFSFRNDVSRSTAETANAALFGEATYEFVPTWRVTLGGRLDYTSQDSSEFFSRTQPLGGVTTVSTDFDSSFDEFNALPKIGIAKELTESQTVGATFTQGFRTGGSGLLRTTGEVYAYDPERVSTGELFYKGVFLDDRLRVNANLFYNKFTDQQVETLDDPLDALSSRIANAAESESYGFELESSFDVTAQLSSFLSLGYLHTEFLDFTDATFGDFSGEAFPEAPEWTVGFGATYRFENGFFLGGDAKYTSSTLARFGTPPVDRLDDRIVANFQAGYRAETWEVDAFVENAFDEEYFTYNDNDIAATLGERRKFGVTMKAAF